MRDLIHAAALTAVDQPFAYSAATMRLLANAPEASGDEPTAAYLWRRGDRVMRQFLSRHGLKADYVMTPVRCLNLWRALALARLAGFSREEVCRCDGRLIETHPRVALAVLLARWIGEAETRRLIRSYKSGISDDPVLRDARAEILTILETEAELLPEGETAEAQQAVRNEALDSVDQFEALICAYVALLHSRGETMIPGFDDPQSEMAVLELEGAAVLPRFSI